MTPTLSLASTRIMPWCPVNRAGGEAMAAWVQLVTCRHRRGTTPTWADMTSASRFAAWKLEAPALGLPIPDWVSAQMWKCSIGLAVKLLRAPLS